MKEYKWDKQMIKDLIDPTGAVRAIGRTTILIECYLEIAKENPHQEIMIRDHHIPTDRGGSRQFDHWMKGAIGKAVDEANIELSKKSQGFNRTRYTFHPNRLSIKYETTRDVSIVNFK